MQTTSCSNEWFSIDLNADVGSLCGVLKIYCVGLVRVGVDMYRKSSSQQLISFHSVCSASCRFSFFSVSAEGLKWRGCGLISANSVQVLAYRSCDQVAPIPGTSQYFGLFTQIRKSEQASSVAVAYADRTCYDAAHNGAKPEPDNSGRVTIPTMADTTRQSVF